MSTSMSPVTTFVWGGCPPTPLGQEKPVPCMEQVHLMGSWTMLGWAGVEVTVSGREKTNSRVTHRGKPALRRCHTEKRFKGREESWGG